MKPSVEALRDRLAAALPDARLEVVDDSAQHAGHAGAAGGAGHFRVRVVSSAFEGRSRVARHRLVYDAIADWMPHRVHALAVVALTPAEGEAAVVLPPGSGPLA